jgi:topoisomerase-4 subunit A
LIDFAIAYFAKLKEKYGKGAKPNRTSCFDDIEATKVVLRNTKLYVKREGFVGTSLKKDEYLQIVQILTM